MQGDWFDGGYGTGGYAAEGTAYIYFANQNCSEQRLRKPIIFLDGFDPDNSRDYKDIFDENINKGFIEGNVTTRLGNELRANGYDIIIFDYNKQGKKYDRGGSGYIENNGLAVAKLLTTLYGTYSSTIEQDFVVIGPSMGALVGQYALAHMEKNSIPHHTRLFVSFDGPHQGANVSIGLQSFVDIFLQYGNLASFKTLSHGIHQSASAKQMLVDHSSVFNEAPEPHPFRYTFLQNLAAVGNYPTQCRSIAITSGSANGTQNQNFNPCDKLVQVAVKKRLLPNCTNNFCYKMKADMFASASSNRCLSLGFFANGALYNVGGLNAPPVVLRNTQPFTYNTSYDKAPGSRFQENALGNQLFSAKKWLKPLAFIFSGRLQINDDRLHTDTFVPSVSAVDFRPSSGEVNLYTNLSQYELNKCSGRTPFDKVYIGNDNLYHVEINSQIAEWFREEVYNQKTPVSCTPTSPTCGSGTGLTTKYFNNQDLQGGPVASFSGNIDISGDQSNTLPGSNLMASNVSARWQGQIEAPVSGSYTFNVRTDDGVRVWFDNQQRVDDFGYYPPKDHNFSVSLTAGQKYNLKVEWKQGGGGFEAKMFWSYPGQSNQIVPVCWLFPASGGGGCTTPNPPSLGASPSSTTPGQSSTLSATGCSGSVTWSNGLGTGNSKSVNPTSTTTYTATCTVNGCTSGNASVTVTVGGGGGSINQCIEAENSNGNGPITSDPNASGGSTRGAENNYNHYVDYTVTVPSAGSYTLSLQYYALSGPTLQIAVIAGGSGSQSVSWPGSGSWNIVHTTQNATVNLAAGSNTIRIQGTGGGSCCQDRICVSGGGGGCTPPNSPMLSASPSSISSGQSSTLTASGCSGTVTWSNGLGTGNSKSVSPGSTTTYTATCTANGCTSGSASVTVTVGGGGGSINQCIEAENSGGNGPITGDPNASGGSTRGAENNFNHYVDYTVTGVPNAGNYTLTLQYYAIGTANVSVQVGGGSPQPVALSSSGTWNIVHTTRSIPVALAAGSNTIRIQGTGGNSCRQDRICVTGNGTARLGVAEEPASDSPQLTVSPNPNSGEFEASFYVEPGRRATLRVSDVQGREVWKKNLVGTGMHREPVRLPAQSVGSYILLLQKEATEFKANTEFKRVIVVK